jgi:hypothetical protein
MHEVRYYRRMNRYLKTHQLCPKLSKFSNVNVPTITVWRVAGRKAETL